MSTETSGSRRAGVAAEQSAESFGFDDRPARASLARLGVDQLVSDPLVRPLAVKVSAVFAKRTAQRVFPEEDQVVDALRLYREYPSLCDRVHVRGLETGYDYVHACGVEDGAELHRELRIAVDDEVAHVLQEAVVERAEVAGDLGHEGAVRVRRDPRDVHGAGRVMNDEEHVVGDQATGGSIPQR
jgi:hypothetical protein